MSAQNAASPPVLIKSGNHNEVSTAAAAGKKSNVFVDGMLQMPSIEYKHRSPLQMAVSVLIHIGIIAILVIVPGYFVEQAVQTKPAEVTLVYTPPAPVPPPPAAAAARSKAATPTPVPHLFKSEPLVAPRVIPKNTEVASNEAPATAPDIGVLGGVDGGVSGGVLGGILGSDAGPAAPVAPKVLRVGGDVKPPQLLKRVEPTYPIVAQAAHVDGTVDVDAVIDPHGNVIQERAVDGPSLLRSAALDAVKQWKYQPTYLNGQPVALDMEVSVTFHLG